jgi:hypothetical protein
LISVVVVNWNRKELLRACLRSLAQQTGVTFETIVVDNGSSDGTVSWLSNTFPQVEVDVATDEREGMAEILLWNQGRA